MRYKKKGSTIINDRDLESNNYGAAPFHKNSLVRTQMILAGCIGRSRTEKLGCTVASHLADLFYVRTLKPGDYGDH